MGWVDTADKESLNLVEQRKAELKHILPEIFVDEKIDCNKLREALGDYVETGSERYSFNWAGRIKSLKVRDRRSKATLTPCKKESVDFDKTKNIFIEGENLEVLKILQKAYQGKTKMIYIDPPYNTGKDFVYKDDFSDSLKKYLKYTGQIAGNGEKITTNAETGGRYHSNWLNMMYSRLFLARNLLRDDGVIFVSIDDNEIHNLRLIMNEIFGEENFITNYARISKKGSSMGKFFSPSFDYVVCYTKNIASIDGFKFPQSESYKSQFGETDENGKFKTAGLYQSSLDPMRGCTNQRYYIECPDKTLVIPPGQNFPGKKQDGAKVEPKSRADKVWRWTAERYLKDKNQLVFVKSKNSPLVDAFGKKAIWNVYTKQYLKSEDESDVVPGNIIDGALNQDASSELKELRIPFDFPKPTELIRYLMQISRTKDDDLILDFFAGSGTTAHAVLAQNAEDGGNRKFILVQLPEPTPEDSEAFKAGYKTIADICKERIRRAIKKIKEEQAQKKLEEKSIDTGFKVFRLSKSNCFVWDEDAINDKETLAKHIGESAKGASLASNDALLFELMLREGFKLDSGIEQVTEGKNKFYKVTDDEHSLWMCFDDSINEEAVKKLSLGKDDKLIVLDSALTDTQKVNLTRKLRIETV